MFLTTTLPFDSLITVVATGDVTDPSGNALADFSSTFSTGSTVETIRPQILTQRPTGPGIPADTDITLFVSKPLNESTVAGALYVAQNGVLVEGAVTVSGGGTAVHFNPAADVRARRDRPGLHDRRRGRIWPGTHSSPTPARSRSFRTRPRWRQRS